MTAQVENGNGALVDAPASPRMRHVLDPTVWSLEAYVTHTEAMRAADKDFGEERDRRYKEVNIEKEKALKIKETADLAALGLAREIQDYKDQKANGLRGVMESERGNYATRDAVTALSDKFDTAHAPVLAFISATQGQGEGKDKNQASVQNIIMGLVAIGGLAVAFFAR